MQSMPLHSLGQVVSYNNCLNKISSIYGGDNTKKNYGETFCYQLVDMQGMKVVGKTDWIKESDLTEVPDWAERELARMQAEVSAFKMEHNLGD